MKKKNLPVTNIGSVSLLMVFIVLCLVTFAVLSLSSSLSDYHVSQKSADHNQEYYASDTKATLILKDIDTALQKAYAENPNDYFTAASPYLQQIPELQMDFAQTPQLISYEVPVNDTHTLCVSLTLQIPRESSSDGFYEVTRWQEVNTADWKGNDKLNLMK